MFLLTFSFSLPAIFTLLAASNSRSCFHHRYKMFTFFFQRNWSPLFIYLSLQLFLWYPRKCRNENLVERKNRIVFFLCSKSPGGHAIHGRNAWVLEMQNFIPSYMNGWTYVRTILSEPKFLGFVDNQLFYPRWSAARVSRALELHY